MKLLARGWHRKLLFRSYLFLVAGLLAVATVLDLSFDYLQSRIAPTEDRWLENSFRLIEAELVAAPPTERDAVAARLGREIGLGVQVLQQEDIVAAAESGDRLSRLTDATGRVSYLRSAPSMVWQNSWTAILSSS